MVPAKLLNSADCFSQPGARFDLAPDQGVAVEVQAALFLSTLISPCMNQELIAKSKQVTH